MYEARDTARLRKNLSRKAWQKKINWAEETREVKWDDLWRELCWTWRYGRDRLEIIQSSLPPGIMWGYPPCSVPSIYLHWLASFQLDLLQAIANFFWIFCLLDSYDLLDKAFPTVPNIILNIFTTDSCLVARPVHWCHLLSRVFNNDLSSPIPGNIAIG